MPEERNLHLLVDWKSRRQSWWSALRFLLTARGAGGAAVFDWLLPDLDRVGTRPDRRAIFSSFLMHFAIILFCARVPMGWLFAFASPHQPARQEEDVPLIYPVPRRAIADYLPTLQPPGRGGKPGHGKIPDKPPARGSLEWHPRFTVVSNPAHPDNPNQTIIQPTSPPDLKIKQQLDLPNIVLTGLTPPRMPLKMALNAPAPAHPVETQTPVSPDVPFLPPEALPPPLAPATVENPHLPVPVGTVAPQILAQAKNSQMAAGLGGDAPETNAPGLIVLSANAGSLGNLLNLPPGNRYGEFAISPAGGRPGSPGGEPGGVVGGGTGGAGSGGDSSAGVGSGNSGGGGSGSGAGAFFSVKGGKLGGSGAGLPALSSTMALNMVYPVTPPTIHIRENSLVVSAGPIGGGGLDTYGVLRCSGIFTVYLSMPRASWPLEYCREENAPSAETPPAAGTVQLAGGIVPPQPEKQFDFHRPPVPPLKANKLIILKGKIAKDGSVGDLKVLQGVTKLADEAALAAFSRWKFKPALEGGEPIAIDFMVGIPATVSGK